MAAKAKKPTRVDSLKGRTDTLNSSVTSMTRAAFAEHLDRLMQAKGMSQSDLARAAFGRDKDGRGNIVAKNRHLVSKYLRGLAFPTSKVLKQLAKALDLTPNDLLPPHVSAAIDEKPAPIRCTEVEGEPTKWWIVLNRVFLKEDAQALMRLVMDAAARTDEVNHNERYQS